jgi:flagellar basal-body rod protein FlgB
LANSSTPGYVPADISFKSYLEAARSGGVKMAQTDSRHLQGSASGGFGSAVTYDRSHLQHNGNGVRIDQEMLKMQQTNLDYSYMAQLKSSQSRLQKIALGRAQ